MLNVKVMMLKGEKGDTGNPTDNQVEAQIANYINHNPEKLSNPAREAASAVAQQILTDNLQLITEAINNYAEIWDCDGGYAFTDMAAYTMDYNGGYPA